MSAFWPSALCGRGKRPRQTLPRDRRGVLLLDRAWRGPWVRARLQTFSQLAQTEKSGRSTAKTRAAAWSPHNPDLKNIFGARLQTPPPKPLTWEAQSMSINTVLSALPGHCRELTPYAPGWTRRMRRKTMVEAAMLAPRPVA
jgi:hypothetical protein